MNTSSYQMFNFHYFKKFLEHFFQCIVTLYVSLTNAADATAFGSVLCNKFAAVQFIWVKSALTDLQLVADLSAGSTKSRRGGEQGERGGKRGRDMEKQPQATQIHTNPMPTQINLCVPHHQPGSTNKEREEGRERERQERKAERRKKMQGKAYCKLQATLVEWQQIVVSCRGPPTRHVTLMNFGTSK